MRKLAAMVLAGTMLLGSITGCGSSSKTAAGSTVAGSTAAGGTAQTEAAQTQPESKDGGNGETAAAPAAEQKGVKISTIEGPITLFLPQSSSTGDRWFASPAVESLGRLAEDGTTQPWLAKEFITDPDALTFTIKLRDGVKFHDGSVCDAEAVAWNIEQYMKNGKSAEIDNPKEVTADDDLTEPFITMNGPITGILCWERSISSQKRPMKKMEKNGVRSTVWEPAHLFSIPT